MRAVFLAVVLALAAGQAAAAANRTISTSGSGKVTMVPDQASIAFSVSKPGASASEAADLAAEATTNALDSLSVVLGLNLTRNLQSTGISITPNYVYDSNGNGQIDGYTFEQDFSLVIDSSARELDVVISETIDALAGAGENVTIGSFTLGTTDETARKASREARRLAVADAISLAELFADAASVTLGDLISLVDRTSSASPLTYAGYSGLSAVAEVSTPVSLGTATITASVGVEYEISSE